MPNYIKNHTALRLHTFWIGTRLVLSPLLISTNWFLILSNEFKNGYVLACSTACRNGAEVNEMSDHGIAP